MYDHIEDTDFNAENPYRQSKQAQKPNPFAPISATERLKSIPVSTGHYMAPMRSLRPGEAYGQPKYNAYQPAPPSQPAQQPSYPQNNMMPIAPIPPFVPLWVDNDWMVDSFAEPMQSSSMGDLPPFDSNQSPFDAPYQPSSAPYTDASYEQAPLRWEPQQSATEPATKSNQQTDLPSYLTNKPLRRQRSKSTPQPKTQPLEATAPIVPEENGSAFMPLSDYLSMPETKPLAAAEQTQPNAAKSAQEKKTRRSRMERHVEQPSESPSQMQEERQPTPPINAASAYGFPANQSDFSQGTEFPDYAMPMMPRTYDEWSLDEPEALFANAYDQWALEKFGDAAQSDYPPLGQGASASAFPPSDHWIAPEPSIPTSTKRLTPQKKAMPSEFSDPFEPATPKNEPLLQNDIQQVQKQAQLLERKFAEKKSTRPAAHQPQQPRINFVRLAALIAVVLMVSFCLIADGIFINDLLQNEQSFNEFKASFNTAGGVEYQDVVVLPPAGQTFAPTSAPTISPIAQNAVVSDQSEEEDAADETVSTRTKETNYSNNPMGNIMDSVASLYAEYPEVIGQITIAGVLDEVVVQRNNMYYLTHDYQGAAFDAGAIYVDESCSIKRPPENLLLRGQSDFTGESFAPLRAFKNQTVVSQATRATLKTLYEEEEYVLFAVIAASSDTSSALYFNYASQPTFASDDEMLRYVEKARERSLFQFNVEVAASDRLLTLATVSTNSDESVVLIYRMLRSSEK